MPYHTSSYIWASVLWPLPCSSDILINEATLSFMALNPLPMNGEVDPSSSATKGFTSAHSDLLKLPAELLYIIYQHLPPRGALALTFTCTHLYYSVVAAEYVRQAVKPSKTEEEFDTRCVLEDACLIKGYHCQGCRKRHSLHCFSNEELAKEARDRYCLRTKVCFRMTPLGYELSFNDLVEAKN